MFSIYHIFLHYFGVFPFYWTDWVCSLFPPPVFWKIYILFLSEVITLEFWICCTWLKKDWSSSIALISLLLSLSSLLVSPVFKDLSKLAFIIRAIGNPTHSTSLEFRTNMEKEGRREAGIRDGKSKYNISFISDKADWRKLFKVCGQMGLLILYFIPELDGLRPRWHSEAPAGFPNKAGHSPPGHRQLSFSGAGSSEGERTTGAEPSILLGSSS